MDEQPLQEQLLKQPPDPQQDASQHEEIVEQQQYDVQEVIRAEPVIDSQIIINTLEKSLDLSSGSSTKKSFSTPHNSYTVAFKINVLDWYYANGENKSHTSKQFGVDRKRIRDWLQSEDHLRAMPLANRMRRKKFPQEGKSYGKRPPGSELLDQAVLNWYKEQRAIGNVVYSRLLRAKALELGPQCGLPETFKASAMWLQRWKKRHAADIKAADIKEVKGEEEGHTDGVKNVIIATDFEEHLRQLEQVSAHLTDGQDNDLALVASTNDASIVPTGLQMDLNSDPTIINQGSNSLSESGTSGSVNGLLSPQTTGHSCEDQLPQAGIIDPLSEKIRDQEQWIGVVEQTLDSLEVSFSKKIGQVKLVIQQLKSVQEQMKQQLTSSSTITQTSLSTPGANKRPSSTPVTSTRQVKRPRKT